MRTSQEVKDELEDIKRNSNATDGTENILTGWIEALEWVLSEYKGRGRVMEKELKEIDEAITNLWWSAEISDTD